MAREHFLTVMSLFKGSSTECIRQYQVTLSVRGLHQYLKKMNSLMPFFFNKAVMTDKGHILDVMQNAQGRWHVPLSGNKAIGNEKVTVNLFGLRYIDERSSI